ncbi:MAG: ABC transporter permease [Flavobacteriales bacterium]|nr:ABC transporter permease [Flavobacteriales bacterium]
MWQDLYASKELSWRLARRDISAQYRGTILGYLWAFILPLANTLTWVFLQGAGIVKVADTGMPYAVYVLTGTMLWQMFIEALQSPLQQVTAARSMLAKLNFPREALIVSGMIKWGFNAIVKVVVLVPVIMLLGVRPNESILLLPFAMAAILVVGTAIGLLLAPVGLLYTDIGRSIPILAQFAMFITPVVFAMPQGGLWARLFQWNFMTPLLLQGRAWLTGSWGPMALEFLVVLAVFSLLLFLGWAIYRLAMPILIERMSS